MVARPEAEHRRRPAEPFGEIGKRRDADAPSDEEWALDFEAIPVPERPEHVDRLPTDELHEGARSGADRVDEKGELPASREAEAHRPGKEPPGRAGFQTAPPEANEAVGPDPVDSRDGEGFPTQSSAPGGKGRPPAVPARSPRPLRTRRQAS